MLPDPLYLYQPVYGVDPWEKNGQLYSDIEGTVPVASGQFGGGAKITGQNLLISLWWVETTKDLDGITVPASGALLIPKVEFGNVDRPPPPAASVNVVAGRDIEFLSRTAARFLLNLWDLPDPPATWTLLAALNPPPGMKERLANATEYTQGNGGITGFSRKPLLDSLLWNAEASENISGGPIPFGGALPDFGAGQADAYAAGGSNQNLVFPLLKTSGADGVYPEFFGGTPSEILAEQEARNKGDFYVPMQLRLAPESGDDAVFTLSYPHSAARGH